MAIRETEAQSHVEVRFASSAQICRRAQGNLDRRSGPLCCLSPRGPCLTICEWVDPLEHWPQSKVLL